MDRPGSVLREAREKQKRSLSDVSKKLKINVQYLKALEEDDYAPIPAEVFTRAYLRSYAELLGIDGSHILELYSDHTGRNNSEKADHPDAAAPSEEVPARQKVRFALSGKSLLLAASIALVLVSVAMLTRPDGKKSDAPELTVTGSADRVPFTEGAAPPETEPDARPDPRPAAEPDPEQAAEKMDQPHELNLTIEAIELTWVSVVADQGEPREWLLRAGESLKVSARDKFSLKIGNAGGTRLLLNNTDVGFLGPRGTIVDIVLPFEKSG